MSEGEEKISEGGEEKKFLGAPYDFRRPTVARFKARWWNPDDRRLFTPKVYGWGWVINLYRVAHPLRRRPDGPPAGKPPPA
jgi:hypothetical protein